jgi:pyrimidine deaminase RibD-like protein
MILNDFTVPKTKFSNEQLDFVLAELCGLVIEGQQDNPDFNGMVAAAVIDPKGRLVTGLNYLYGSYRVHAERAAIDKYEEEYGELSQGSIVVTTLSPCSDRMDSRYEESCTDLLNSKRIKLAYCGYNDPSQENVQDKFITIITENSKIKSLCKKFADTFLDEDYDPNGPPPGPEFKPTMPAGTVKVDVSDVYDWYKLGQNISNLDRANPEDFGKGPPSTIMAFGSEKAEHNYINNLKKLGLDTTDIDPLDPNQPKGMVRQKTDPTYNVDENFADGKGPGRPGDSQRHGISKGASMAELEKASHSKGRKGQLARWQLNMRRGKKK